MQGSVVVDEVLVQKRTDGSDVVLEHGGQVLAGEVVEELHDQLELGEGALEHLCVALCICDDGVGVLQLLQERLAELGQDVVDLGEEAVGAEERAPSLEDGVCDAQDADVDGGVVGGQARDEVGHEGLPLLPEVAVGDGADGLTELGLQVRRHADHQADQLALDGIDLVLGQQVDAILVDPVALDVILEVQGAGEADGRGEGIARDDLKKAQGEARLVLFLGDGTLSCGLYLARHSTAQHSTTPWKSSSSSTAMASAGHKH